MRDGKRNIVVCFLVFLLGVSGGVFLQRQHVPHILKSYVLTTFVSSSNQGNAKNTGMLLLKVRKFQPAADPTSFDTERDATFAFNTMPIPISQTALVLIDVWADHANDGWRERADRNVQEKLVPLLQAARKASLLIIHAPHGRPIHPLAKPLSGEVILGNDYDADTVFAQLKRKGIKNLIYAGYASNMCVIGRPIGIIEAHERGFKTILVRDSSIAVESPESLDGEWAHKITVLLMEIHWGWTTTVKNFSEAVAKVTSTLK